MRIAIPLFPLILIACGSSSSGTAVVTLGTAGVDPASITVGGGARLQFTNADFVDHQVASGNCPELTSGTLASGASFTTTLGAGPKTCTFDDGIQPSATSFQGTVIVQSAGNGSDAGYGNPYGP